MKRYKQCQTPISALWSWGINPTMEQLVSYLTGQIRRMPTAALAHIELPIQSWEALNLNTTGTLVNLWTPKTLFTD